MSTKINVALVCTSINQMGGKNVHFRNMYLNLNNDEMHLIIVLSSSMAMEHKRFMIDGGVREEDIIFIPRYKKWLVLPFILDLRSVFISRKISIVHTFQIQSDIFGGVAAFLSGIRGVVSHQESKIFEENISLFKVVFYKLLNGLIKHIIKRTITVSAGIKKELVFGKIRPEDKINVIPLGVSMPLKYRQSAFSFNALKEGRPLIGAITRLNKEKGIDRFIQSIPYVLEKVPRARFIIVGMGSEEDDLKKRVSKLNLKHLVEFRSWTSPVYDLLESIDIFVMPSIREGCPTALLEALAFSRPVVASNIEGINDLIEDGRTGLMIDTANPILFAQKLIYLCMNPDKAIAIGSEGRRKILGQYTLDSEMEQYRKLYREVLKCE